MLPQPVRTPRPAAVPPAARGLPGLSRHALREALADRIERYLAILDRLDGDPDLDADGWRMTTLPDGRIGMVTFSSDDEPSLCGAGTHEGGSIRGLTPSTLEGDDREHDDADGPEGDDEREPDVDDEPTLCGITCNSLFATGPAMASGEAEPSLASLGGTADGCEGSQLGWAKGDLCDREIDTGSRTHNQDGLWREPGDALVEARQHVRRLDPRRQRGDGLRIVGPDLMPYVIRKVGR